MIRYIITKILNKYKLYLCLVIGVVSIVMVFAMMMMFRDGSCNKLIQRGFTHQREVTKKYPMILKRHGTIKEDALKELSEDTSRTDFTLDNIKAYENSWEKYIHAPVVSTQRIIDYKNVECEFAYSGKGHLDLVYMESGTGESLSEHYDVVYGGDLHEDIPEYTEKGCKIPENAVPVLISQFTADSLNLVPGEVINIYKFIYGTDASDTPLITLYINGIISEKQGDYFWHIPLNEGGFMAIMEKQDLENILKKYPKDVIYDTYKSFDYRYIGTEDIYDLEDVLRQFSKKDEFLEHNVTPVIKEYREKSKSVSQILYVIVLPLIVLVMVFIGMIAFRIIDSENGELTTLKNRGLSKVRLIGLYFLQSLILAAISLPIGLGLGFLFGKIVAGVTDFMGFSFGSMAVSVKDYRFNHNMIISGAIGTVLAMIIMMLPVFIYFKKKKTRRKNSDIPVWERYFIDVALLAVSIYLLFNYNKQIGTLSKDVLNGNGIDPVIFINSTLFLFSCGMLMLRIIFYFVRLYYKIGEKKFKPVTYAGILQIMRTRKASGIISIFLVMTVAMSLFNANMARTINRNKEERIKYNCGTDIRIQEHWKPTIFGPPGARVWKYNEPDFDPYEKLRTDGVFSSVTKVLVSDKAILKVKGKETPDVTLMGIHTKEFGETATLRDDEADEHWFNYLNALAVEGEGVIISQNLADLFKLKIGDSIKCDMCPPEATGMTDAYATTDLKVVAIVDKWPGYIKYKYENEVTEKGEKIVEKENYLAIMNYGNATNVFGMLPYEVWGRADDGVKIPDGVELSDNNGAYSFNRESDIIKAMLKEKYVNKARYVDNVQSYRDDIRDEKSSAILQITNGLFTADFLIALILCIIGYMIYWITSIRDRELLFGIYRAMGISRSEINNMLGMEQVFLSLMAIVAGVLAGTLASRFFVRVFAAVYLPEKHNIDLFISSYGGDMVKLAVVLLVVVLICIFWIRRIVKGLNITEALKLGDD